MDPMIFDRFDTPATDTTDDLLRKLIAEVRGLRLEMTTQRWMRGEVRLIPHTDSK